MKADPANNWCFPFVGAVGPPGYYFSVGLSAAVLPPTAPTTGDQWVYYIYGLDSSAGVHRMPFNRVDYYLGNNVNFPSPKSCAAGTFTLFRSTIKQADGTLITTPLIDCVMDFQVAFGIFPNGVNTQPQAIQWQANLLQQPWMQSYGGANKPMIASQIQSYLREVRVFLVYQEGLGDLSKSPSFRFSGFLNLGDQDIANSLDPADYPQVPNDFQQWSPAIMNGALSNPTPSGQQLQYRWKVVEMAVKPMNLIRQ